MNHKFKLSWFLLATLFVAFYFGIDSLSAMAAGKKPAASESRTTIVATTPAEAASAGSAVISGKVSLSGAAPPAEKIKMAADPACMQQHTESVTKQEVVANNGMLQYVLVYVKEGIQGSYPAPAESVTINQKGCMYEPHVFGIQVGQKLEISNSDSTLHNINCQAAKNKKFNLAQPTKGMKTTKTFDQPEIGVPFKCNVPPWMTAYAGVFNHPFFAVTDANGVFQIKGLPAGTYTIEAWQEKLGTQGQKVTVADGESKEVGFSFAGK